MLVIILVFVLCVLKNTLLYRINLRCKVFGRVKKCLIKHFGDLSKAQR